MNDLKPIEPEPAVCNKAYLEFPSWMANLLEAVNSTQMIKVEFCTMFLLNEYMYGFVTLNSSPKIGLEYIIDSKAVVSPGSTLIRKSHGSQLSKIDSLSNRKRKSGFN